MAIEEQKAIGTMFDSIAATYDRINRILSFGQDERWRKKVLLQVPKTSNISVLDVATGTGDLLIALCRYSKGIDKAVGIDLSSGMLDIAKQKIIQAHLSRDVELINGDACSLPFAAESFDIITLAFGIRNVVDYQSAMREFARVLKICGCLLILEFSLPKAHVIKWAYLCYFRYILPVVGGFLSKNFHAYRYLNRSVEAFPYGEDFKALLLKNGFATVAITPLTFGIATLYCARKI